MAYIAWNDFDVALHQCDEVIRRMKEAREILAVRDGNFLAAHKGEYRETVAVSKAYIDELLTFSEDARAKIKVDKQVQTERGLIYVKEEFSSYEAAEKAGYGNSFYSKRLDAYVFSRCLDDKGLRHEFAIKYCD